MAAGKTRANENGSVANSSKKSRLATSSSGSASKKQKKVKRPNGVGGGNNQSRDASEANSTDLRAAAALRDVNANNVTERQPRQRHAMPLGLAPRNEDEEEEDDDDEDDPLQEEDNADDDEEDGVGDALKDKPASPPAEVDTSSHADTASTMTGQFYSESFARRLLKPSAAKYEAMVMRFVVHEVFKDMKFTQGDDEEEMGLAQLSIDEKYVIIDDAKIPESAFVSEFYPCIAKDVTVLQTRSITNARKKFQRQFKSDLRLTDEPDVLPESLADILLDGGYRNYLGDDGKVKPEREYDYEAFKWFVKNVLFCVNHELTELLSKQVSDMGYNDFITKTYTPSDEAFAVMLVVNYEKRWQNQVLHPM